MITLDDTEIGKHIFYHSKDLIPLEDVDIDNSQVSSVSLLKKQI